MQKLISKYFLAAHLGLLTAAPLFLYPYVGLRATCTVMMLLSLFAATWTLMEPSRRRGEMLHEARQRVLRSIVASPVFHALLIFAGYSLVVHFNSGLAQVYDAASGRWSTGDPRFPGWPASVAGAALPALAASTVALVACSGARFGLGRAARAAFLFVFSLVAGVAGFALATVFFEGDCARVEALVRAASTGGSFVGCAFGAAMLAGVAAVPASFERDWTLASILLVPAIAGSFTGMFLCSTTAEIVAFTAAAALLVALGLVYSVYEVRGPGALKVLTVFVVSIAAGVSFVAAVAPEWAGGARIDAILKFRLLPRHFLQIRAAVDAALVKAANEAPWTGCGVGTFDWNLLRHANPEDWSVIPQPMSASYDGWIAAFAERGFVGGLAFALVLAALFAGWVRRFASALVASLGRARRGERHCLFDPQAWLGPVAALAIGGSAYFGEAPFSAASVAACATLAAFSINVFRSADGNAGASKRRGE